MRALLLAALLSAPCAAEDPLATREARLDQGLRAAHDAARVWHWSWVGTFSGLVAAQGALVGVADDSDGRWIQAVGGVAPLVGLGLTLGDRLSALDLESDLAALEATARSPVERVSAKRRLLRRYARAEAAQRGWFAHVGPLFLNASIAAVSGFAFDDWINASIQLGAGVLISEIKVLTAPDAAGEFDYVIDQEGPGVAIAPVVGLGYLGVVGLF